MVNLLCFNFLMVVIKEFIEVFVIVLEVGIIFYDLLLFIVIFY